jgi:hypothetical protein
MLLRWILALSSLILLAACSDDKICPAGTGRVSGECRIVGDVGEHDFTLPKTLDLRTFEEADLPPDVFADADESSSSLNEVVPDETSDSD